MRRMLILLLAGVLLAGCGGGFFKVPKDDYRQTVRALGVLPLLVDGGSTVTHPEREAVLDLLRRSSAGREGRLIEMVRDGKSYFDVRPVAGDPERLFADLVRGGGVCGSGERLARCYEFAPAGVAALAQRNVVDALLIVVLHGVERPEKRWDRLHLNYLEASYNDIEATAAVVLPSGEIVWEYAGAGGDGFLPLQYPDFDEAYYNLTDAVRVKYISLGGLERALAEQGQGLFGKSAFPQRYEKLLAAIAAALQPGMENPFKRKETPTPVAKGG